MIVSASYRTDIPAFYGEWFRNRFRAGFARVANPYGGKPYDVPLRAGVDGFVFWTRNAAPFLPVLREVRQAGYPFVIQYTVTGYPRALETATTPPDKAVATIRALAAEFGPRAVVWRYDPIVATNLTPPDWHVDSFTRLADALTGAVDEACVSWATIYKKTARNMATAARAGHFGWEDPPLEGKQALLATLAERAAERGLAFTLCSQEHLLGPGIAPARCIDAGRLADIGGRPFRVKTKGNRPGCLCAESRDIGDYDTCPHGCVYCYAVSSRSLAKRRYQDHDPASPSLGRAAPEPGGRLL
jgi:nucleotide-binding universal stress UspA family protein